MKLDLLILNDGMPAEEPGKISWPVMTVVQQSLLNCSGAKGLQYTGCIAVAVAGCLAGLT